MLLFLPCAQDNILQRFLKNRTQCHPVSSHLFKYNLSYWGRFAYFCINVILMKKNYLALITIISFALNTSAQVYSDVAGIFYNRCAVCHHVGGGAHFALTSYSQTSPWCLTIQTDLNSNYMPPWPPDTMYTRFLYERIITPSEKGAILNWISSGCQQGDTTLAPTPPTFPQYQLYGTPSLPLPTPVFP